ncbi:MAG: AAA family ATPase [Candidatus Hydrothermarchaeota archaeon]|nr:AAA family ATPase [Candidatus Hydrothermarchaeota archaeon]
MIITVGGLIGSGKTTVVKALAKKFKLKHVSAGEVFRSMAEERGLSLEELTKLAEKNHDLDKEVDEKQKKLAASDAIVDGRLSGWLIDADLKIWLRAPLEVRAKRVARRENKSFEQALKETKRREESEAKRYREIYKIDIADMSPYNAIIDTSLWSAEEVISIIEKMVSLMRKW